MATTGTEVRSVSVSDLRGIILDSDEVKKGTEIFDRKALLNLSRQGNKLHGEVKGSDGSLYRMTLTFSDSSADVKAQCTCPAARNSRRPFCKHAAALLIAWSRAPESFVVGGAAPEATARKATVKRTVKRGDPSLIKEGVTQISTLVRELGVAGVATGAADRVESMRKLGESLRENGLIWLSARTLDLANLIASSAGHHGAFQAVAYTDLLTALVLMARKLDKHVAGEPLAPRHIDALIGKTWRESELEPASSYDLLEYAYLQRKTSDDYEISESRYFDLATGVHLSEKRIAAPPPAPRTDPKPSYADTVLVGLKGRLYPGYPPIRIKVMDLGDPRPVDPEALGRLVDKAMPDVGSALAALQDHRRDVFAPDLLPAAIRVDTLFARGDRLQAVDDKGNALHLPPDGKIEHRLGTALHEGHLKVLIGDLGIDAALPTLRPLAAVFEGPHGLELRTLVDPDPKVVRQKTAAIEPGPTGWIAAARAAGAGGAAIALGEVREELADAFALGLAGISARVTTPLAARLRDLGLEKQAALLEGLLDKPAPEDRLDDFVKLYQILGMALLRLAGATTVDRATLERVPTYESVFVARPGEWLPPDRVTKLRHENALNRYEAAVHYAHHYEGLPAEELAEKIYPIWADGSAAPFVVRAFAGKPAQGLAAAKKALATRTGRVAKITAIQVLEAVGGREAEDILANLAMTEKDAGLRARAREARDMVEPKMLDRRWRESEAAKIAELSRTLITAPQQRARKQAIDDITSQGLFGAIPALRQAFLSDRAHDVREEAALALGLLGDTEMAETLVKILAARDEHPGDAANAARALGHLGDVRGVREICAAFAEDFQPRVLAEALRAMGVIALEPLIAMFEARPELAERRTALDVLGELPDLDLAAALIARLEKRPKDESFPEIAMLFLKLAAVHPESRRAVAKVVLEMLPPSDPAGKAAKRAMN